MNILQKSVLTLYSYDDSPEDISVTWEDSHVYDDLTLGKYHTIPVLIHIKGLIFIKRSFFPINKLLVVFRKL